MDWWQGRQTNYFNGWLNKLNLNSCGSFHLLCDYWKKRELYKLDNRAPFEVSHYFLEKKPHLNGVLQGECCLFQIKISWRWKTQQITGVTQSTIFKQMTWSLRDRNTCVSVSPAAFNAISLWPLKVTRRYILKAADEACVKSLYWNYAPLRLKHKRRICRGIKMLIKQAGCNSCFKPHEICMAPYEPYAEKMARRHATERNKDHFMLCWESAVLTPDTNAQPLSPREESQLINVISMNTNSLSDPSALLSAAEAFWKHIFLQVAFLQPRLHVLYVQPHIKTYSKLVITADVEFKKRSIFMVS